MSQAKVFFAHIKKQLGPHLKQAGFKTRGRNSIRHLSPVIYCVALKPSMYGGQCCVELGVQFDFMPCFEGRLPDAEKTFAYQCDIQRRMVPDASLSDYWWSFGNNDSESEANARALADTFVSVGLPYFDQFKISGIFERYTADESGLIAAAKHFTKPPEYAALLIARVFAYLLNPEKARTFANAGLKFTKDRTSLLARELSAIANVGAAALSHRLK